MTYRGLYIDDEQTGYAELLSDETRELSFTWLRPKGIKDLIAQIAEFKPDVVALDYRLDENQQGQVGENNYRAGGVAQLLREAALADKKSDCPIVLVSNETKIVTLFRPDRTAHDLFDGWYAKERLNKESATIQKEVMALIDGYRSVHEAVGSKFSIVRLLNLADAEWEEIGAGDLEADMDGGGLPVHVLARNLLQKLVHRTGPLLSPHDVFARLAVAPDEKSAGELWQILLDQKLGYEGVFSSGWPRVWRHRLEAWTLALFGKTPLSLMGDERVAILREKLNLGLAPAVSKWTKSSKEYFSFACASCMYPTEQMNSVSALDSGTPVFGERKRICFDCVVTDKFEKAGLKIASKDLGVVRQVRSGKMKV